MKCSEVMTKDPVCCLPSDTVVRAAQLMKTENVGAIPVVANQQSKRLIGIVTDRDLALKVVAEARDAKSTPVEGVMTAGVIACRANDDLQKALNAMEEYQVRRIPVVDDNAQIIGIIAQADVATRINEPKKTAEVVEEISKASATGS
jgi:CBS domain-containing protein